MLDDAEEERVQRAIIDVLADNYDLIAQAQDASVKVDAVSGAAQVEANKLRESLVKLQAQSAATAQAGHVWHRKRQVLSSAVAQQQRLLALAEAPALVEECIRGEMYHEALLVTEHMLRSQACADQGGGFFARANLRVRDALETSLEEVVLPRLSGPLSVDAAFRIVTFLRRLGTGTDRLRVLFLERRTLFIERLIAEADGSPAPYSRIIKHINVYKVHVCEVVMQYFACFPVSEGRETGGGDGGLGAWDAHLRAWCHTQMSRYVAAFGSILQEITHGAELALVVEQCSSCSASVSKLHMDVAPLINRLIIERVKEIFAGHMHQAVSAYTASMRTFSWRTPPSYAAAYSASGGTSDAAGAPPLVLAQWLPLAYALNGILTALNAVRKCLVSGAEMFCVERVSSLVGRIASDLIRDGELSSTMEEGERRVYSDLVKAFVMVFYPHVVTCFRALLTVEAARWLEAAQADAMETLLRRLPAQSPAPTVMPHPTQGAPAPAPQPEAPVAAPLAAASATAASAGPQPPSPQSAPHPPPQPPVPGSSHPPRAFSSAPSAAPPSAAVAPAAALQPQPLPAAARNPFASGQPAGPNPPTFSPHQ